MIRAFKNYLQQKVLCNKKDKILLAVSGGVDSVVMLDLFCKSGYKVAVAHCNFRLRSEESDMDELFVRNLARSYKVEGFFKAFETNKFADENKLSIQEAARELRYSWFEELSSTKGFSKIATAHHLDDQTETFFINLFRGSGLKGLKGIPIERGKVIRPLMFTSRKEIETYAGINKLNSRTDSSNESDKYLRNRIRHSLLPELNELQPDFQKNLQKSFEMLKEDSEVLELLLTEKREQLFIVEKDLVKIKIDSLVVYPPDFLFYLLAVFGLNRNTGDFLLNSLKKGESGKQFITATHRLLIDRNFLLIKPVDEEEASKEYLISESDIHIDQPIKLSMSKFKNSPEFRFEKDPGIAYFDLEKISFPLTLRKWRNGDRFVPFGMEGSKLVSDFLTDVKVTIFEKEDVWVLLSDDEIIWVIGYRTSNRFKVKTNTNQILKALLLMKYAG